MTLRETDPEAHALLVALAKGWAKHRGWPHDDHHNELARAYLAKSEAKPEEPKCYHNWFTSDFCSKCGEPRFPGEVGVKPEPKRDEIEALLGKSTSCIVCVSCPRQASEALRLYRAKMERIEKVLADYEGIVASSIRAALEGEK